MRCFEDLFLETREPPEGAWVPLITALTWIRFAHAADLDELSSAIAPQQDVFQDEDLRIRLQEAWHDLADHASIGRVAIRGQRQGERKERELGADDLRNCRFLAWSLAPRKAPEIEDLPTEINQVAEYLVRVERYEDTFSGHWERYGDQSGFDFVNVMVSRSQLMALYPPPKGKLKKRRSISANLDRGLRWIEEQLDTLPLRSRSRPYFLERMQIDFTLSSTQARHLWT